MPPPVFFFRAPWAVLVYRGRGKWQVLARLSAAAGAAVLRVDFWRCGIYWNRVSEIPVFPRVPLIKLFFLFPYALNSLRILITE